MAAAALDTTQEVEQRRIRYARGLIGFEDWLDLCGEDDEWELVAGVMVERPAVDIAHERLFGWLLSILGGFAEERNAGIVLGPRSAVQIDEHTGRMPELLYVARHREHIVRQRAIYGAPDLVIEIVGTDDRPTDAIERQADYRRIGVPEVWFVNQMRQTVRVLRKTDDGYDDVEMADGELQPSGIPGLAIRVQWLFDEPRPTVRSVLAILLGE